MFPTTFTISYYVKFRAFFITFGTISGVRTKTVNLPVPIPSQPLFKFNDRGLDILLSVG